MTADEDKHPTQATIGKWLRNRFASDNEAGPCSKVSLFHESEGARKASLITDWAITFPEDGAKREDYIEQLASEVFTHASQYVEAGGHTQRFVVKTYFGVTRALSGKKVFMLAPDVEPEDEDAALDTEGRNPRGLVSQAMRHSEVYARYMTNGNAETIRTLSTIVEKQGTILVNVMERWSAAEIARNEAEDRRHQRAIELEQNAARAKSEQEATRQLTHMLPIVANRLAGGKVFAESATPREHMVSKLMGDMTDEQFQAFLKILNPEQQVLLAELVKSTQNLDKETGG